MTDIGRRVYTKQSVSSPKQRLNVLTILTYYWNRHLNTSDNNHSVCNWHCQTVITLCVTDIVRHYSLCVSLLLNTLCVTAISLCEYCDNKICPRYLLTTGTDAWTLQTIITLCVTAVKHCVCVTAFSLCEDSLLVILTYYWNRHLNSSDNNHSVCHWHCQTLFTLCVTAVNHCVCHCH